MSTQKVLTINPALFMFNGGKKSLKKTPKTKPYVDKNYSIKTNKLKKELLKRVKDYQKTKETESQNEEKTKDNATSSQGNNLFDASAFENNDFEREFNKSLTFLHELSKKKKEKRAKSIKASSNIDVHIEIPKDSNMCNSVKTPSHGCLKNGTLPTFRQLNKTQKHNISGSGKKLIIDLDNNKYFENKPPNHDQVSENNSTIEIQELKEIQVKPQEIPVKPQEIQVKPQEIPEIKEVKQLQIIPQEIQTKAVNFSENNLDNKIPGQIPEQIPELIPAQIPAQIQAQDTINLHIPKINRITRTYKYTLGKKNGSKHVGLLIKNRETQKRIRQEVTKLKEQPIQDVKNYLRNKNLIKLGSQAPNDVLRKLYEDSILAGEITNNNANNLVYNFNN